MHRRRKPLPQGRFEADIVDLSHTGQGLARVNGKVTFIADALPGERVAFRYTAQYRDADHGQALDILQASSDRVTPRCPHFGVCGGCSLQHLAPAAQIRFKQKQLLDALQRIGRVQPETVASPITGASWGYRRRARLGVKDVHGRQVIVGFRERESGLIGNLSSCPVLDERVGAQLPALAALIAGLGIRDQVAQIEVAAAAGVCLVLRVLAPPSAADQQALRAFSAASGFELRLQPGGHDSIQPLDPPARELAYSPDGSALRLRFEPTDFIQINADISQRAVLQALDWLAPQPGERVLELFCGLGNFSLPIAACGAQLVAVEGEAGLVRRARENAQANGLEIRFEQADLFRATAQAPWLQGRYDKLLLDPPRSGASEILPLAAAAAPQRIVYVSCHPGTLARDAGTLVHDLGYRLQRVGVMDMFPHTAHVESMALFERARA
ncbi:MAG: 23S rRNA (uracil(1939)-C(5))-methyltransferase RlmD [Gammaproteobacteria bacterium]|jgi:23S rRNA (uracil1939-C5)-methyltransferase